MPLGDGIFLTIDGAGVDGADGAGVVVFNTVGGIRCVGVDDPKATTVDFVCKTRLIRAELVNAKTSTLPSAFCSSMARRNLLGLGRNSD